MKLNLGCCNSRIEGYKGVDINKYPNVDIISPVDKLSFAVDNSIEEIYASNILEHFSHLRTQEVLNEWNRVLKPRGKIFISVPDIEGIVDFISKYGYSRWIEEILYGGHTDKFNRHYAGFTLDKIIRQLENAGFKDVVRVDTFPHKLRDCSAIKANDMIEEKGCKVILNVIARK